MTGGDLASLAGDPEEEIASGAAIDVSDNVAEKTYQSYTKTKTNSDTGEVYSGRISGTGSPEENLRNRDYSHSRNSEGFGPATLDQSSSDANAIRGRE